MVVGTFGERGGLPGRLERRGGLLGFLEGRGVLEGLLEGRGGPGLLQGAVTATMRGMVRVGRGELVVLEE